MNQVHIVHRGQFLNIINEWNEQGRIYIGASGYMAPGPEVPGGPFEGKNKKIRNRILLDLRELQAQTELIGIRPMLRGHRFRVPTI